MTVDAESAVPLARSETRVLLRRLPQSMSRVALDACLAPFARDIVHVDFAPGRVAPPHSGKPPRRGRATLTFATHDALCAFVARGSCPLTTPDAPEACVVSFAPVQRLASTSDDGVPQAWKELAGTFADDPLFAEFREAESFAGVCSASAGVRADAESAVVGSDYTFAGALHVSATAETPIVAHILASSGTCEAEAPAIDFMATLSAMAEAEELAIAASADQAIAAKGNAKKSAKNASKPGAKSNAASPKPAPASSKTAAKKPAATKQPKAVQKPAQVLKQPAQPFQNSTQGSTKPSQGSIAQSTAPVKNSVQVAKKPSQGTIAPSTAPALNSAQVTKQLPQGTIAPNLQPAKAKVAIPNARSASSQAAVSVDNATIEPIPSAPAIRILKRKPQETGQTAIPSVINTSKNAPIQLEIRSTSQEAQDARSKISTNVSSTANISVKPAVDTGASTKPAQGSSQHGPKNSARKAVSSSSLARAPKQCTDPKLDASATLVINDAVVSDKMISGTTVSSPAHTQSGSAAIYNHIDTDKKSSAVRVQPASKPAGGLRILKPTRNETSASDSAARPLVSVVEKPAVGTEMNTNDGMSGAHRIKVHEHYVRSSSNPAAPGTMHPASVSVPKAPVPRPATKPVVHVTKKTQEFGASVASPSKQL